MKLRFLLPIAGLVLVLLAGCGRQHIPAAHSSAPAVTSPDYRDTAREAGLRFSWKRTRHRVWDNRDGFGCGCAFVDYNGDGWMDIFLAGEPRCALFRNNGDGTYTDVSAEAGVTAAGQWTGIATGDYDNDGYPDLYISGFHCLMLLHNEQGRGFSNVTGASGLREKEWGSSAAFFDADGDGKLDLFVGHYVVTGKGQPQYCPGSGGVMTGCPPKVYPAQFPRLYRGDGRGHFTDVTAASGLGMAHGKSLALQLADYDNDGLLDFYVANDGEPGDLFRGLRGGRYENVSIQSGTAYGMNGEAQAGMGVDFADYDHDGLLDLVVTTFRNETFSLYRNQDRLFEPVTARSGLASTVQYLGFGTRFIDYDDDTWPDLVFADGHVYNNVEQNDRGASLQQPTLLYHNENGRFTRVLGGGAGLDQPIVGRGLAVGDPRNDGSQDLLLVNLEGEPLLLHNHRRTATHWLGVALRGARGNRDGIGARVTVQWPGGRTYRDASNTGSYLSAMDPRLHFGLGSYSGPVTVTVQWPGGAKSTYADVAVDGYVRITEGAPHPTRLPPTPPHPP